MNITPTNITDCLILQPQVFEDHRGYFLESFNQQQFEKETGLKVNFVQDNESMSAYGTLRGLHMQKGKTSQAKLVRVVKGKVLDVVVDVRPDSPTFKQKFEIELSEENKTQLFVPKGCLHGFSVLSETAIFSYKCDDYYDKTSEAGVNPLDPALDIDWKLPEKEIIMSTKDQQAQSFEELVEQ